MNTRLVILLNLLCSFAYIADAQNWLPTKHDTLPVRSNTIIVEGNAQYLGTGISTDIAKSFFYGGVISQEIKEYSLNRHRLGTNLFNLDISTGVQIDLFESKLFNSSRYAYSLQLRHRNYLAIQYPKSLFQLIFFGNQSLGNGVANISGTRMNNYNYQKVGFGVLDKKNQASLHLNIVNMRQYQFFSLFPGYLEQSLPDSIQLYLSARNSSFQNSSSTLSKGVGISIDFGKQFHLVKNNNEPMFFQIGLTDLGFAYVPQLIENGVDTMYNFDGESIEELTSPNSIFNTQDTLSNLLGFREISKGKLLVLPFTFQMSKDIDLHSRKFLQEYYGVRYRYLTEMQVYFGLDFNFVHSNKFTWHFGINTAYGGGANLTIGSYSHLSFNRINFGVVTENVLSRAGESLKMRLTWAI